MRKFRVVSSIGIIEGPGNPEDRYTGIRILWLKVIQRAMFDYVIYKDATRLEDKKKGEDAHGWLFKPSVLNNGLESICHLLGIDHEQVRYRASRMSRKDVVKMEHLERGPALQPMFDTSVSSKYRNEYATAYPKDKPVRVPEGLYLVEDVEEDEDF